VHDVIPQVPGTPENHQDSRSCELINVAKQYLKPILPRLFEEVSREQVLDRPHGIPKGHSFDAYNCGMIGILLAIAANGAAAILLHGSSPLVFLVASESVPILHPKTRILCCTFAILGFLTYTYKPPSDGFTMHTSWQLAGFKLNLNMCKL
jgi:hypothetical protein